MKNFYYFFFLEICMGYGKDKKKVNVKEIFNFKNICKYEID